MSRASSDSSKAQNRFCVYGRSQEGQRRSQVRGFEFTLSGDNLLQVMEDPRDCEDQSVYSAGGSEFCR